MRSFTKKLAFVMALAMVVTLATPAIAQVSAATTVLYADQNAKSEAEAVTSITLTVGENKDMKFLGAPANWRDLFNGWTSSDTKIATVDKSGIVTAVAAGVTTVKVDLGNTVEGTLQVIVKAKATEQTLAGFEQVSEKEMKINLGNTALTLADVQDKINFYYYVKGTTKIKYPVNVTKVENGVATVKSYAALKDGKTYEITYGTATTQFVASVGTPEYFVITDNASSKSLYDEVTYSIKYYDEQTVDVTSTVEAAIAGGTMLLTIEALDEEDSKATCAESTGTLSVYFYEYGTYRTRVTLYRAVDDNGEGTKAISDNYDCTLASAPAYEITGLKFYTIKDSAVAANDTNTKNHKVYIGEDFNTKGVYLQAAFNQSIDNNGVVTTDTTYGEFTFESTDPSKLYVTEDGALYANETGDVQVIVYFKQNDATDGTVYEKDIVEVLTVTVEAQRAVSATRTTVEKATGELGVYAEHGLDVAKRVNGVDTFTTTIQLKDQYGDNFNTGDATGDVECKTKITAANVTAPSGTCVAANADGKYTVTITGDYNNIAKNAQSAKYTFEVTIGTVKKTINVTFKNLERYTDVQNSNATAPWSTKYDVNWSSGDAKQTTDDVATTTATLYQYSNGIKYEKLDMLKYEGTTVKKENMLAGKYYYKITSSATTNLENPDNATVALTAVVPGTQASPYDYVKLAYPVGTRYTCAVYYCKDAASDTATYAARAQLVKSATVDVKNTVVNVTGGSRTDVNTVDASSGFDLVAAVKTCFKFNWNNGTAAVVFDNGDNFDNYAKYGVQLEVDANYPNGSNNNAPAAGDTVYVRTVTFYIPVSANKDGYDHTTTVYNKSVVTINKTITLK